MHNATKYQPTKEMNAITRRLFRLFRLYSVIAGMVNFIAIILVSLFFPESWKEIITHVGYKVPKVANYLHILNEHRVLIDAGVVARAQAFMPICYGISLVTILITILLGLCHGAYVFHAHNHGQRYGSKELLGSVLAIVIFFSWRLMIGDGLHLPGDRSIYFDNAAPGSWFTFEPLATAPLIIWTAQIVLFFLVKNCFALKRGKNV